MNCKRLVLERLFRTNGDVETYKMSNDVGVALNGLVFLGTNKHFIESSSIIDSMLNIVGSHMDEHDIPIIVMGKSQIMRIIWISTTMVLMTLMHLGSWNKMELIFISSSHSSIYMYICNLNLKLL